MSDPALGINRNALGTAAPPQQGSLRNEVSRYIAVTIVWRHGGIARITCSEQGGFDARYDRGSKAYLFLAKGQGYGRGVPPFSLVCLSHSHE